MQENKQKKNNQKRKLSAFYFLYVTSRSGSVLVFTIIITGLMMATVISLISVASIERKMSGASGKSTQAMFVADSGAEVVLKKLSENSGKTLNDPAVYPSCSGGSVEITPLGGDRPITITFYTDEGGTAIAGCGADISTIKKIKSVGTYGGTSRAIKAAVCQGWIQRTSENRTWSGVASDRDGINLVAIDQNGLIYVSRNSGETWLPKDNGRRWVGVASSANGSNLVATVAEGGQIYKSSNGGDNWDPRDIGRNWRLVASSARGDNLVATVHGGDIYFSTDRGDTWIFGQDIGGINGTWPFVASDEGGVNFVVAVMGDYIYTSSDSGDTWNRKDRSGERNWSSVASDKDGVKLVATVQGGFIYTSSDGGDNWIQRDSSGSRLWSSVASSYDGNKLVAATNGGEIYISINGGETWKLSRNINAGNQTFVASSADGNKIVATIQSGTIWTYKGCN